MESHSISLHIVTIVIVELHKQDVKGRAACAQLTLRSVSEVPSEAPHSTLSTAAASQTSDHYGQNRRPRTESKETEESIEVIPESYIE